MSSGVEFEEQDDSTDPVLTRNIEKVAAPVLPSLLVHMKFVKTIRQANVVLACVAVLSFVATSVIIAEAATKDYGQLEEYPAQDVSKGV